MKRKLAIGLMMIAAIALIQTPTAQAKDKWQKLGELTEGGQFAVNKKISTCKITCIEGVAVVNTFVYWDENNDHKMPVKLKLEKGVSKEIAIGDEKQISKIGFHLETAHGGKVEVFVK